MSEEGLRELRKLALKMIEHDRRIKDMLDDIEAERSRGKGIRKRIHHLKRFDKGGDKNVKK